MSMPIALDPALVAPLDADLGRALSPFEQERATLERQRASLYDSAGRPVHRPDVHREQATAVGAALADLAAREAEAIAAVAARAVEQAQRLATEAATVEARAAADPMLRLGDADRRRAVELSGFYRETLAGESPQQLAARLRAAQLRSDPAELALLDALVPARLAEIAGKPGLSSAPGLGDAQRLAREIAAALRPGTAEAAEQAKKLRRRASDLQVWASRARSQAEQRQPSARRPVVRL